MDSELIAVAAFFYAVFLFSTVCHEAAHAIVARLGGDPTAHMNGQVTLNPVPHIRQEPFGLGLLPLITLLISITGGSMGVIGFASAPFDPHWAVRHPRRAAWMGMAGPAANFVLAAVGLFGLKAGIAFGWFQNALGDPEFWRLARASDPLADGLAMLLGVLFFENLLLGVWNLMPIPPMDGFSALLFVLPPGRTEWFFTVRAQIGMMFPLLLIGLSSVFWKFFNPLLWWVAFQVLG